jgi:hypothetical protein
MAEKADEPRDPERRKRPASMQRWLETEIWPHVPPEELGGPPLTKAELGEALGYSPEEAELFGYTDD